ncbi:MAG TPA: Nramp family divalent metal transporter [Pirellulales bacterium]|nr:Nramp family divalent metal transporter [Pirellulales bacterium]
MPSAAELANAPGQPAIATKFEAPHPGAREMPRWNTGELIDAPTFTWKNWFALLGPGLLMGGAAIGGGEWLTGPLVTARYGGALLWLATLSILFQVVYNLEISRYTLYSGEPIFTGKFRTLPGPRFWLVAYLLLDFGSIFPYLAASAATPLVAVILGEMPDAAATEPVHFLGLAMTQRTLLNTLGYAIFLLALVPLIFGGKIYNSLKVVMSFKIVTVFGFLLVLAFFFSRAGTWTEIISGFVKFGNVPVMRGEDANGNGRLDPGEDWDGDGHLDVDESLPPTIDSNGDGRPDSWPDADGDGKPDTFRDLDHDGIRDGDNIDNVFLSLFQGRGFPRINLSMMALLCAMVAISGQGGLSNTPLSNYTRDQGWGMGHLVGAIPSVVGGHHLQLSHVGCVFQVTPESLSRWRRWYRHVMRDQLVVWMPACFIGLGLPSMLSVQFLPRGTEADRWTAAGLTAKSVGEHVANGTGMIAGPTWGNVFWFLTLLCGFLVLAPTMASSADGVIRRWLDVFWTSSARLRRVDPKQIGKLYFGVLCCYAVFGLLVLRFVPGEELMVVATNIFNYALGFSCWHALAVNLILLPRELRPGWFVRIALFLAGVFFLLIAGLTTYTSLR